MLPDASEEGPPVPNEREAGAVSCKPPFWADALLTLWVIVVGVFYFGGFFFPAIGSRTAVGEAFYAGMILVSALTLALRFLRGMRPKD